MGAQYFNFAPNFPKMGIPAPNFAFLDRNFLPKLYFPTFSRQPKI